MSAGYNLCFFVSGRRGTGKDFCLAGGVVNPLASLDKATTSSEDPLIYRQREPGLIRLAFETVVAQIATNPHA